MQREIKFRGKRLDNAEWLYGDLIGTMTACPAITITSGICGTWFIDPDTIGQFTGCTDRNGKEIYEGDIIEVVGKHKRAVVWDKIGFALMPCEYYHDKIFWVMNLQHPGEDWWEGYADSIEVVGNIHDNPELLKGGDNAD